MAGFAGGFIPGVGNSLVGGSSFGKGLLAGLRTLEGGIAGGLIGGLDALRFIVRVILKVTITLLSILFWLAILCTILLCVL